MKGIITKPLVSVALICYNQEKYITQAIEGVLCQQTNFSYEFIISDDNSKDSTAAIIRKYQENSPDIIKANINRKNIGMVANMVQTLDTCTGEYVAILEGDDYWTEPTKLQKQIDFLISHPEISFCFHNARVIYELNRENSHLYTNSIEGVYTGENLLKNWAVPTASVVYRNTSIPWPSFTLTCVHGDNLLFQLLLEKGDAYAFPEVWSVRRKIPTSYTAVNFMKPVYLKKIIKQLHEMKDYFPEKYERLFISNIEYFKLAYLIALLKKKQIFRFIREAILFTAHHPGFYKRKGMRLFKPNNNDTQIK